MSPVKLNANLCIWIWVKNNEKIGIYRLLIIQLRPKKLDKIKKIYFSIAMRTSQTGSANAGKSTKRLRVTSVQKDRWAAISNPTITKMQIFILVQIFLTVNVCCHFDYTSKDETKMTAWMKLIRYSLKCIGGLKLLLINSV